MVIKNEIQNLQKNFSDIFNYFEDVIIVDTGSTDGCIEYLIDNFSLKVIKSEIVESTAFSKSPCRNIALEQVKTDWILSLDADEQITVDSLKSMYALEPNPSISGYFAYWDNYIQGQGSFFDYKLFLYRKGTKVRGLVHENAQIDLRIKGQQAVWTDCYSVMHFPDASKHRYKTHFYKERLKKAIQINPDWLRYYWFLGYMLFQQDDFVHSTKWLKKCYEGKSSYFPVEQLNSIMCSIQIYSILRDHQNYSRLLKRYIIRYHEVSNDFEVKINTHLVEFAASAKNSLETKEYINNFLPRFAR